MRALDGAAHVPPKGWRSIYGTAPELLTDRTALAATAVKAFRERFGNGPVHVLRAPGRVNLRGMHVDTHGGWLNLMTHHREVIAVAAPRNDAQARIVNAEPGFAPLDADIADLRARHGQPDDWDALIACSAAAAARRNWPGDWRLYLQGALLRASFDTEGELDGFDAVIASDLPRGAALSSSHALSVLILLTALHCDNREWPPFTLAQAARDVEWYAGARTGLADQTGIVLGRQGHLLSTVIHPGAPEPPTLRHIPWPEGLQVIVADSRTTRSLSGPDRLAYTRNRFAYSLALDILRYEMREAGLPSSFTENTRYLSDLSPGQLEPYGGGQRLLSLLKRVPETASLPTLRERYDLPELDTLYDRYFGALPEARRPAEFALRGPLLFGVAESERARLFGELIETGRWEEAGRLMLAGHNGDRRYTPQGSRYQPDVSRGALDALIRDNAPIHVCPGGYGASSAALDGLVDAAMDAGSLGASLTGAGIAGSITALAPAETAPGVVAALRGYLASATHQARSGAPEPLAASEAEAAVTINTPVSGAGALIL